MIEILIYLWIAGIPFAMLWEYAVLFWMTKLIPGRYEMPNTLKSWFTHLSVNFFQSTLWPITLIKWSFTR